MYSLYHYAHMIASKQRVECYTEALRQHLTEDAVVCDLGTGLGLFAILAAQLGARRVYAIEPNEVIGTAAEVARDSGYADRIEFIQDLSTNVSLPEPADLIVSDLRGTLPFHGGHIPALIDARRRLLKPGGRLIPRGDTLWLSIVRCGKLHRRNFEPWIDAPGVDLGAARRRLLKEPGRGRAAGQHLLPERLEWGKLDYETIEDADHHATVAWRIAEPATGYGLCLWFDSELASGVTFSNAPDLPMLPYGHLFLPWEEPLELACGQWITVSVDACFEDPEYAWRWAVTLQQEDRDGPVLRRLEQSTA